MKEAILMVAFFISIVIIVIFYVHKNLSFVHGFSLMIIQLD